MATEPDTQNGRSVKRDDGILPATQMEGACLGVNPLHQSPRNPMPLGERGGPQEIHKSLLSQKRGVSRMGPRSEQCPEESGPDVLAKEPLAPLHLKLEATH